MVRHIDRYCTGWSLNVNEAWHILGVLGSNFHLFTLSSIEEYWREMDVLFALWFEQFTTKADKLNWLCRVESIDIENFDDAKDLIESEQVLKIN